eukprot:scaffold10056_cov164-Amphora_coffeaeformis.AAC.8
MASPTETTAADTARKIRELLEELPDERADAARLDELRRLNAKLIQEGDLQLRPSAENKSSSLAQAKWQNFLRQSHKKFVQQLKDRIQVGKRTAIRTLWGVVATSPVSSANGEYQLLHFPLLVHWVQAMAQVPVWDQSIHHMVEAEFLGAFRDVQYYTMLAIQMVANEGYQNHNKKRNILDKERFGERLLQMLMLIPLATSQQDLDENVHSFLFPIPESATPDDKDDDDSSQGDTSVDDKSVDANDSSDEDDEEDEPKAKRQKVQAKQRFAFEQTTAHARQCSKAWLSVLRLDMPVTALKQALQFLPTHVLPHVRRPLLFADFYIQAYQHAGIIPILALDGLFVLLTQHGLEYPDYYKQLYKLVTPTLFYVRYRTRFFRLLDKSISRNELLPAQTVAAFCKRLLRSALQAPPAGILTALALVSNWLRKHAETAVLIHASNGDERSDPFDSTQDDPAASQAIHSSLWELQALSQHYYPAVVTLAAAVGSPEQDKAPLLDMEDLYQQSYHNLFEQERKRQRKSQKTPLTFRPPKQLFPESDVFASILDVPAYARSNDEQA